MPTLILVNGEERFLMERAVQDEISVSLSEDVTIYDFPDGLESYLYDSQIPLMSGASRAYVLLDVVDIPQMPEGDKDTLICVAKSSKKPLTDSRARRTLSFPKLKSFSDNNDVLKWILKEGERFNIDLSRVAAALFVSCGNNLRKIASEVEKLSVLTPRGTVVSPDDARTIMCFSADLTPQPIVDAICDGHSPKAIAFYDKLQEANDETGWIIAFLQRFSIQQLRFELLREKKAADSESAEVLGLHPFIFKKMVINRQGLWQKKSLLSSIDTLCELDVAHKRGDVSVRFGLESEIIRLAEEAKINVKR